MRNVIVAMLVLTSAAFAADEGESFIAAGLSLTSKNPEVAKDMLVRGLATSANPPAKAYLELAKLSENEKDVAVSLYMTAYRMSIQDAKLQNDCKFIMGRLQIISKPTADLLAAMGSYAAELDTIQKTRKDEMTQDTVEERREQLSLSSYVASSNPSMSLLPGVNFKNVVSGVWKRDGTGIVSDNSEARFMLPDASVPAEYDVKVDLTRKSGDGSVVVILVKEGRQFVYEIGGWQTSVAGFGLINGANANSNNSTYRLGKDEFVNGRRYTLRIEVRKHTLTTYLNNKLIAATATDGSNLSLNSGWALPNKTALGVASYKSPTVFHSFEVKAK